MSLQILAFIDAGKADISSPTYDDENGKLRFRVNDDLFVSGTPEEMLGFTHALVAGVEDAIERQRIERVYQRLVETA